MEILVRKPNSGEIKYMEREDTWESECTEFSYHYNHNETCLIAYGRAIIEYAGKRVTIQEGDLVFFPRGLDCHWKVVEPIKKYVR